ncbi:MAG: ATP-binding protein [Candidatus Latescibacterota bacterium]
MLLTIADDVTERRQVEQELAQTQRLRAVAELAAGISHNLNNMLVSVLGPAQLLQRLSNDPEVLREAEEIAAGAHRACDLVRRLSQAVREEPLAGLYPVDVQAVVEEAVGVTRPRWKDEAEAGGVHITVETHLEGRPMVRGRRSDLCDVLVKLLLNAVDAMPQGGTISVGAEARDGWVRLTVGDTGVGMDEETRKRLFQPFFTTKRDVGSGLGLAMVHGVVSRWGGRIRVDSAAGAGATFTLDLPAWRTPEAGAE